MSALGEALLYRIAAWRYQARRAVRDSSEKRASAGNYWQWQRETSPTLFKNFPEFHLEGKDVLDVGCGIGGRTCHLATLSPRRVVGCDINREEIETARRLAAGKAPELSGKVEFVNSEPDLSNFSAECFDMAILIDAMEHIADPGNMLANLHRVLKPGGMVYFGTFGWWHWNASHMDAIIPVPFVQLFFSDRTIIQTTKKIMRQDYYRPTQWDSDPPAKRWEGVTDLKNRPGEHLNKYTIDRFERTLSESPFARSRVHPVGFSENRKALKSFNFLARVPILREAWHSYLVGMAQK